MEWRKGHGRIARSGIDRHKTRRSAVGLKRRKRNDAPSVRSWWTSGRRGRCGSEVRDFSNFLAHASERGSRGGCPVPLQSAGAPWHPDRAGERGDRQVAGRNGESVAARCAGASTRCRPDDKGVPNGRRPRPANRGGGIITNRMPARRISLDRPAGGESCWGAPGAAWACWPFCRAPASSGRIRPVEPGGAPRAGPGD